MDALVNYTREVLNNVITAAKYGEPAGRITVKLPETPVEPAQPEQPTGGTTYVVVLGDTLAKIALKHYGNAAAWDQIFKANTDVVKNPNVIFPGQVLTIPAK